MFGDHGLEHALSHIPLSSWLTLQPTVPSRLTTAGVVPARTAQGALTGTTSGSPPYPFASFNPDGLGSYTLSATASDSCTTHTGFITVTAECPNPGPVADAGEDVTIRRNVTIPVSSGSSSSGGISASAALTSLNLGRSVLMALFGPVTIDALSFNSSEYSTSFAWFFLSVPPGSAYSASPGGLPTVLVDPFTGALTLPPTILSTTSRVTFAPDALGTFVVLLATTDGCSVVTDTVAVTALIDAVLLPPAGSASCPSTAPAPVSAPCSSAALASTEKNTVLSFNIQLGGINASAFNGSAALRAALIVSIASYANVDASIVSLVNAQNVGRRLLLDGGALGGAIESLWSGAKRQLATTDTMVVAVITLPPNLATDENVQRILSAMNSKVQSGALTASLAASPAVQVR